MSFNFQRKVVVDYESSAESVNGNVSLWTIATVLLERRRWVLVLGFLGGALGFAGGLLTPRKFTSHAIIVPEVTKGAASGLAAAASQLGIVVPASEHGWGPPIYQELLRSRELLEPLALDSVVVAEQGGRRAAVLDLLGVESENSSVRLNRAVLALRKRVVASEDKRLGAVRLAVSTKWASVSEQLALRLVADLNRFNIESRQSAVHEERRFMERQVHEAQQSLRAAEDRLQDFLQTNRDVNGAARLVFERDRMQRAVTMQQQLFTTLAQHLADVRMREVRDIPVVTLIERPRLASEGDSRGVVAKALIGGIAGGVLGLLLVLLGNQLALARRDNRSDIERFLRNFDDFVPRFRR